MNVGGAVESGYETVREAFAEAQAADAGGAQLCVYAGGREVVDLWAGRDGANDRPFTGETLSVMMSSSKGVVAIAAHILAERGLLDLEAPAARYWPEFAQAGKADIPVSYLMSHRAGLPLFAPEAGIGLKDFLDWDRCVGALVAMAPMWPPGSAFAYHGSTYGWLVGEVIRRISGKSVGQFVADEIAGPLGLDLWIGLPPEQEHRVAPQFMAAPNPLDAAVNGLMNSPEGHAAEIPAGNGIGNARSLARMYAAVIGEVDGVQLLGPATVDRARQPLTDGLTDLSFGGPYDYPLRFGLGFELNRAGSPMLGAGAFGHTGAGGRLGFAHPESGLAVGYICANMAWDHLKGPDPRWLGWLAALGEIAAKR